MRIKRSTLVVVFAVAGAIPAHAQQAGFTVTGSAVHSAMQPNIRIEVDPALKYVASQRWPLLNIVQAEQHLFVERGPGGVTRFLWIQFEEYLPASTGKYDYTADKPITAFGRELRTSQTLWDIPTTESRPESDGAYARKMLRAHGITLPPQMLYERFTYLPDSAHRRELMVIYAEDAKSHNAAGASGARLDSLLAGLEKRALKSFAIVNQSAATQNTPANATQSTQATATQSTKPNATQSPNVTGDLRFHQFSSTVFGNTRTLRVLLPDGYDAPANSKRQYPVLYLADGQNLFDATTSVFGPYEWHVDEIVHDLVAQGRIPPLIVVGVDNSGRTARAHEYLPYPDTANALRDPAYDPDPQGTRYPDFLVGEVMPFINARYRTMTDAEHTGIGGSSYGGLITTYLMTARPGAFGRALVESPSLSVHGGQAITDLAKVSRLPRRIYVGVGTNEDGAADCTADSPPPTGRGMVVGVERMERVLRTAGLDSARLKVVVQPCAKHTANAWAARLPDALVFLYGPRH